MEFKSGMIVVKKGITIVTDEMEILHFCGYEKEITEKEDWKSVKDELYDELKNDKELNFVWDLDECNFVKCPQELFEYYNEQFKGLEQ